jgi:hypothetical protein
LVHETSFYQLPLNCKAGGLQAKRYAGFAMGRLKLRGSSFDPQRLGDLLAKAKAGLASEAEEAELLRLLGAARRLSDQNAKTVAELRASDTPKKPKNQAKA